MLTNRKQTNLIKEEATQQTFKIVRRLLCISIKNSQEQQNNAFINQPPQSLEINSHFSPVSRQYKASEAPPIVSPPNRYTLLSTTAQLCAASGGGGVPSTTGCDQLHVSVKLEQNHIMHHWYDS